MRESFTRAVRHIARFGDTDIFPFSVERHVFHENEDDIIELLFRVHDEFFPKKDPVKKNIVEPGFKDIYPPVNASCLAQVGYAGFRWATQLDPLWDAYLLGLVLEAAPRLEAARIPVQERNVFSYRYQADDTAHTLFDSNYTWRAFMEESISRAQANAFVVACDIGEFYPRIYHHRIENALLQVIGNTDIPKRIDELLIAFNPAGVSYGLPIGGNAARYLAEISLNAIDHLLRMHSVTFCRYVDDFHLFAPSKEEAFRWLILLSEKLQINEGLALQKSKTRILSATEFIQTARFTLGIEPDEGSTTSASPRDLEAARFMRLRIKFDPYSADPEAEYDRTKEAVERFDVVGMLADEMEKSRIHGPLVKHLLRSARVLPDDVIEQVVPVLVHNIPHLSPVFPQLMLLIRDVASRLTPVTLDKVVNRIIELINERAPVMQLELHKMYALRVLQLQWNNETESTLARLFADGAESPLLRKDILLMMAKWGNHFWLSDVLKRFQTFNAWERRASIVASYRLKDEGHHWRDNRTKGLEPLEVIIREWAAKKFQNNAGWELLL